MSCNLVAGFPLMKSKINKANEALDVYDYFKAKKLFYSAIEKSKVEANYGLAVIYSRTDNPFSNIDVGINCGVGLKTTSLKGKELYMDFRYQKGFGLIRGMNTNSFSMNLGFQIW